MFEYDCIQAIQDQFRELCESIKILENKGYSRIICIMET